MLKRALNQATVPSLDFNRFLDLAVALDCMGVEPRNDMKRPLFDGQSPADAGKRVRDNGLRMIGLSQVYPFNDGSPDRITEIANLISIAKEAQAETISLIPRVDGIGTAPMERNATLRQTMRAILPYLQDSNVIALIEPIGFAKSSLRDKAELVAAINEVNGGGCFKLVHDTFQHTIAGGGPVFPEYTGIVHISGISDPVPALDEYLDGHRVLIDQNDRVDNLTQIQTLLDGGYDGAFSFECTSPSIHQHSDLKGQILSSFKLLEASIDLQAI